MPIRERQKFVVSETEVIHRQCALTGRLTVLQRAQRDLAEARLALATQRRSYEDTMRIANTRLADALRRETAHRISDREATRQRDEARAERAPTSSPPVAITAAEPATEQERDPTETRMSLLELS